MARKPRALAQHAENLFRTVADNSVAKIFFAAVAQHHHESREPLTVVFLVGRIYAILARAGQRGWNRRLDNRSDIVQSLNALVVSRSRPGASGPAGTAAGAPIRCTSETCTCKSESGRLSVDVESHRELKVLEAISDNERTTQRGLASQLGIALGLANLYLKRLARKGYIKCVNVRSNRVRYLITPTGIAEKTRLTWEFMEYSLRVFRESRTHLKRMLQPYAAQPSVRIAMYGTGEAAELAYLCLKELGLEPVAVFDGRAQGRFFGVPIRPVGEHDQVAFDALIVATLTDPTALLRALKDAGIAPSRLVTLRDPAIG